jgi:hypothetical protein
MALEKKGPGVCQTHDLDMRLNGGMLLLDALGSTLTYESLSDRVSGI